MTGADDFKDVVNQIDLETVKHIKEYVDQHNEIIRHLLKFGSPLQKAKASIFLKIAERS